MGSRLIDRLQIEQGAVPINTTGAAVAGDYVSMKNFQKLLIIIATGAWAGGTPAVTLKQATAVAGTGEKALGFTKRWSKASDAGTWTETDVASDTFNLPATENMLHAIEVDAGDLDKNNGFDCVRVGIASPGVAADLIAVTYILGDPRESGLNTLADAKVD